MDQMNGVFRYLNLFNLRVQISRVVQNYSFYKSKIRTFNPTRELSLLLNSRIFQDHRRFCFRSLYATIVLLSANLARILRLYVIIFIIKTSPFPCPYGLWMIKSEFPTK